MTNCCPIVPDVRIQFSIRRQFEREEHELLKKELVCFATASFKGDLEIRLSEKFAAQLFEGEQDLLQPDRSRKNAGLILYDAISEKKMFSSLRDVPGEISDRSTSAKPRAIGSVTRRS